MYQLPLQSADDLESFVSQAGFVPYFAGRAPGYSVEELTAPHLLWDIDNGPWEWKRTILERFNCAYGKFCKRRAAYISVDLLPYYINFRRYMYAHYNKSTDYMLDAKVLDTLRSHESMLSRELKQACGFTRPRAPRLSPQDRLLGVKAPRPEALHTGFDSVMARLQMAGLIVIADFEYDVDSHGNEHGWGIARYTTPEALYGKGIVPRSKDPWKSFDHIVNRLASLEWPGLDPKTANQLIIF